MKFMDLTTCVCGHAAVAIVGQKDERVVGTCEKCGLMRTITVPTNYIELYTQGDTYHVDREGQKPYRERYEHDLGVSGVRWPKLVKNLRLLDVGCANGAFVKYATMMGFEADGFEPNPPMASWASERTKQKIYTDFNAIPNGKYDVITLHDVLEHAVQPIVFLRDVLSKLRSGGLLVIDVPDAGDPTFESSPMSSHHMKPQEHIFFYKESHLTALLARVNVTVEDVDHPIPGKLVIYGRKHA